MKDGWNKEREREKRERKRTEREFCFSRGVRRAERKERENRKIDSRKKKKKKKKTHPGLMFLASSSSLPTHDSRRTLS